MVRLIVLLICGAPLATYADTWRVNAGSLPGGDGKTWTSPFKDLQDGLESAQPGDEIWVAGGEYKPDRGTGDRSRSFRIGAGVSLIGGFAGWEQSVEQRDLDLYQTVLSGDLNGDDSPLQCAEFSDCCREHEEATCDDAACLAIVCENEPVCCNGFLDQWYAQCALAAANYCCEIGGRNSCENSYHVVEFVDLNIGGVIPLDGFTIRGAYDVVQRDGAVTGSGIYAWHAHAMEIRNCRFENNTPYGVWWDQGVDVRFSNCTFVNNAERGVRAFTLFADISDCVFDSNGYGGIQGAQVDLKISRSDFVNHRFRAEAVLADSTVHLSDSSFRNNKGTGVYVFSGGVAFVDHCRFAHNGAGGGGGRAQVHNSLFVGNSPNAWVISGVGVFENCMIAGGSDRGIEAGHATLYLSNSSVVGNSGLGINLSDSTVHIRNSILWGNGSSSIPSESDQIRTAFGNNAVDIADSIVEGWTGDLGGFGNFGADPLFRNPLGIDGVAGTEDDDWQLLPGSPAINAGAVDFQPEEGETDLDGHARVLCGRVDIGAYEFGVGDSNCDQRVDLLDQAIWANCMTNPRASKIRPGCEAFDFNVDSDIDLCDYADLQRAVVIP